MSLKEKRKVPYLIGNLGGGFDKLPCRIEADENILALLG